MQLPTASTNFLWVLNPEPITDWSLFINSWSRLYQYPDLDEYKRLIQQDQLKEEDISWLFTWKNGMNLSGAKQRRVANDILPNYELFDQLRQGFSLTVFQQHFAGISAVWQIFLLHILQPNTFPIFDQHVYRAYRYLNTSQLAELPIGNAKRMSLYHDSYLPFFNQVALATDISRQTIDQALWAFGKFLKQYPTLTKHD